MSDRSLLIAALDAIHRTQLETLQILGDAARSIDRLANDIDRIEDRVDALAGSRLRRILHLMEHKPRVVWTMIAAASISILIAGVLAMFFLDHIDVGKADAVLDTLKKEP